MFLKPATTNELSYLLGSPGDPIIPLNKIISEATIDQSIIKDE